MAFPKVAFALAVLAAGGVALLALDGGSRGDPGTDAATANAATANVERGASGSALTEEARAVAAVRAHLREGGATGELADVALYPLERPDVVAVCGALGTLPVVARVLLSRADAVAIAVAAREGRVPPQVRAPMVIMEAGPGLPRGGSLGGPWERYCRGPQPAPPVPEAEATGAEATLTPVDGTMVDAPQWELERVAVVSPVRVRAGPSGSAEILMTAPRGRVLTVHDRAPGGWLQVGEEGAALGWAHSSLLGPVP